MKNINWTALSDGIPVLYHGDFQPENIIVNQNKYNLIDWRQDFARNLDLGDIYYDLAKLYHGLIVDHEVIRNNMFNIVNYIILQYLYYF